MPYVLAHGKSPHGTDWLNESAAECYLPLLDVLKRLQQRDIKANWTVNLTPILTEQLNDPSFGAEFEGYCRSKMEAATDDARRFLAENDLYMLGLAEMWRKWYERRLDEFKKDWNGDIVGAFRSFQESGSIEIITCCATHGYLPLLSTEESVRAQIQIGVESYRQNFGREPKGIWLPECAYRPTYDWASPVVQEEPWPRLGVEFHLAEAGIDYFFVDSHMIRGGQPLGTYGAKFPQLAELFARSSQYFTPPEDQRSEYEPYRLANGVVVFARDPQTTVKVWSGEHGYPGDPHYLEFHKQLYPGRLRYWRISEDKRDLGRKAPYDPWAAFDRIGAHAADFVRTLKGVLSEHQATWGHPGTLVAMYDTELFGHWWWEGPEFLFEVAVRMAADGELQPVTGSQAIADQPPTKAIPLPEGSWGEGGYHAIWLNPENAWTWERLTPIQRRVRDMAGREWVGVAKEVFEQGLRELLLLESSDWQFLISTQAARDYAEARFVDHADRCTRLLDLADAVSIGQPLTSEDREFLEDCQRKDAAFQKVDLKHWKPQGTERTTPFVAS